MAADPGPFARRRSPLPLLVALRLGLFSGLLVWGALIFQFILGYPPCEICHWQRWPHIAALVLGMTAWATGKRRSFSPAAQQIAVWSVIVLVLIAGGLGVYHAGIEYDWWKGPSSCTGSRFVYTGTLDLTQRIVLCDKPAWQLFGISLAGYNALLSFAAALTAAHVLTRRR